MEDSGEVLVDGESRSESRFVSLIKLEIASVYVISLDPLQTAGSGFESRRLFPCHGASLHRSGRPVIGGCVSATARRRLADVHRPQSV
jgi:hypothetical protein